MEGRLIEIQTRPVLERPTQKGYVSLVCVHGRLQAPHWGHPSSPAQHIGNRAADEGTMDWHHDGVRITDAK